MQQSLSDLFVRRCISRETAVSGLDDPSMEAGLPWLEPLAELATF